VQPNPNEQRCKQRAHTVSNKVQAVYVLICPDSKERTQITLHSGNSTELLPSGRELGPVLNRAIAEEDNESESRNHKATY
jgi:hypothetical protein